MSVYAHSMAIAGVVIAGVMCALLALNRRFLLGATALLIFIDRSPITVHGTYVRAYMPFAALFILSTIWFAFRTWKPYYTWVLIWLLAYLPALASHPIMSDYKQVVIGEVFLVGMFIAVDAWVSRMDHAERHRLLGLLWASGCIVVASGWGQLLIHLAHHQFIRPFGFMREADWYGTVCAVIVVLGLVRATSGGRRSGWLLAALAAAALGLVLSESRAAALQAFVGILWIMRGRIRVNRAALWRVAAWSIWSLGVFLPLFYWSDPSLFAHIWNRIDPHTALTSSYSAGYSHVYAYRLMIYLIKKKPMFGWGAGMINYFSQEPAFRLLFAGGGQINTGHGSANLFLNEIVEAGFVGMAAMISWMWSFARRIDRRHVLWVVLIGLVIDYQFSNGIDFGFNWLILGLLGGMSYTPNTMRNTMSTGDEGSA